MSELTIYIDADACPVTRIAESIARKHDIPVTLLCDTNHQLTSDYSTVKVIGAGTDAVDIALINLCHRGDIVVTQDYGVAALALGKGARAIHQSGRLIVKSLTAKLQNRFHVSTAEIDEQDTHQIIEIGVAAIIPHNAMADSLMEEISLFVEENCEAEILEETREIR